MAGYTHVMPYVVTTNQTRVDSLIINESWNVPPEGDMEGERAVALGENEEPYRRAQAHDQRPTDSGRI